MDILVVVGQVPATEMEIQFDRWLNRVDTDDILYTTSRYDLHAIDGAIRIRDSQKEGTVTLLGIGPPRVEQALRMYLSLGADKAIHVRHNNLEQYDAYGLSLILSQAIRDIKYDLILCGAESVDDTGCNFFLGPYLAEMLGLPQVSNVTQFVLEAEGPGLVVHRKLERGDRQIIRCPLPCLITVEAGTAEPAYPTFPNSLAAMTKKVQNVDIMSPVFIDAMAGQQGSFIKTVSFSPPSRRVKKGLVIDTKLTAAERMKMVMTGGLSAKSEKQKLLTGDPGKLAEQILSILVERGVIRKGPR